MSESTCRLIPAGARAGLWDAVTAQARAASPHVISHPDPSPAVS